MTIRGSGDSTGQILDEMSIGESVCADKVSCITVNFLIPEPIFSTFVSTSLLRIISKMSSNRPTKSSKPEQFHVEMPSTAEDGCIEETSFDKEAENRLLRKLDWHIVPILWLIFMLAFLDRTNVCFAPLEAMYSQALT
jgi:hypothetical protein